MINYKIVYKKFFVFHKEIFFAFEEKNNLNIKFREKRKFSILKKLG